MITTITIDPLFDVSIETMPAFFGAALTYDTSTTLDWHRHETGQLIHAVTGTMRLSAPDQMVLLPPPMALWVPPTIEHRVEFVSKAEMRTIYVRPDCLPIQGQNCRVLTVRPLLRELIMAAMPPERPDPESKRGRALFDLLAAELAEASDVPLRLPMPTDRRIRGLAEGAIADPASVGSVASWTATAPASRKTVERLFIRETGMPPSQWLRHVRLMVAVTALAEGQSVGNVALDLGYATASAFTFMFRRTLGIPPSAFARR